MRTGRGLAIGLAVCVTLAAGSIAAASVVSIRDEDRTTGTFSPVAVTGAVGTDDRGATAAPADAIGTTGVSTAPAGAAPTVGAPAPRTGSGTQSGAPAAAPEERPASVDPVVTTTTTRSEDHSGTGGGDDDTTTTTFRTTTTTEPDDD